MQTITTDQLRDRLSAPNNLRLLEVLSPGDYEDGHIPGALNVPFNDRFDTAVQETIPHKDQWIAVYCSDSNCSMSAQAAERMESLGYTNVIHFADGKSGWKDAGLPLDASGARTRTL